jgi:hypothetical protein
VEQIIRSLSCKADAPILGRSFQGKAAVRFITFADHRILTATAQELPLESRARLIPEERLEAALLLGDRDTVEGLVREEDAGIAWQRREYLYSQAPARNRQLVQELQSLYRGKCQICLWDPKDKYGESLCHGHHIHWLSRGGEDIRENMVLICPNHHSAIHGCDAHFDYGDMAFEFGNHREALCINHHLVS